MGALLELVGQVCHVDQVQGKHLVNRETWEHVVGHRHQVLGAHALTLFFDRHLMFLNFNHGVLYSFFNFKQNVVQFVLA